MRPVICLAALAFSIWWSKRSSLSDGLSAGNLAAAGGPSLTEASAPVKKKILVEEEPVVEPNGDDS